jgi:hypothetical protein
LSPKAAPRLDDEKPTEPFIPLDTAQLLERYLEDEICSY